MQKKLKDLCEAVGFQTDNLWQCAKSLSVAASLKGSKVGPSVCYSALRESSVIDIADRLAIIDALNDRKRIMRKFMQPVILSDVEWQEPPDERTYAEKAADFQRAKWAPIQRTRASYNREERAWRAYIAVGAM